MSPRPPRTTRTGTLLCLAACLAACPASPAAETGPTTRPALPAPEPPVTGPAVAGLESFDRLMLGFLRKHKAPGAALAVGREGKLVYARGFGYADQEARRPVQPDALFRIASISKPVTAVALLQWVQRGKLRLEQTLLDALDLQLPPHADPRWRKITLLHLLQHTAGFDAARSGDPMFMDLALARRFNTPPPAQTAQILRHMLDRPLDFEPGTRFAYSNFGYCLLGRVIEKTAGQPYDACVRRDVLTPCGATAMRLGRSLSEHRAEGEVRYYSAWGIKGKSVFQPHLDQPVPAPYGTFHLEAMDSHGGWLASAPDLVRFALALDPPRTPCLLDPQTILTMFRQPQFAPPASQPAPASAPASRPATAPAARADVYYGLGWNVRPARSGRFTAWHLGGLPGTSTILVRRHDGLTWAVLFNSDVSIDGQWLAAHIDSLVHVAAAGAKW